MKDKIIGLVDGNNFFAGCEVLMNPALKGKAVCVLSNNDGCVISRSYEAKKLGIKMGAPYFIAKKEFPEAVYLSSNFALYHDISMRMMQLLKNYTDKLDIYSIDEAFLDLTGCDEIFGMSYSALAEKIKNDIEINLGIGVSAGIANSKVLAKLAAEKAKKQRIFSYFIEKNMIKNELENVPIEDIWGIGRNTARSLRSRGIFYADEILLKDDDFYRRNYGKKGLELKYELSGISVIPLSGGAEKPKSIQKTRAFPEFSKDKSFIAAELAIHLHSACRKLRENAQQAGFLGVMLRTKDFRVSGREMKLNFYTNSELKLAKYVKMLFDSIYKENIIYRASGVYMGMLRSAEEVQMNLFYEEKEDKRNNLPAVMDKIEDKYGKGAIAAGVSGIKETALKHKRRAELINNLPEAC